MSSGLDAAVERRTANFGDTVWRRPTEDPSFELAAGCDFRDYHHRARHLPHPERVFRYEVAIRDEDRLDPPWT